jgi:outer membrane biosynthesis protein TonB
MVRLTAIGLTLGVAAVVLVAYRWFVVAPFGVGRKLMQAGKSVLAVLTIAFVASAAAQTPAPGTPPSTQTPAPQSPTTQPQGTPPPGTQPPTAPPTTTPAATPDPLTTPPGTVPATARPSSPSTPAVPAAVPAVPEPPTSAPSPFTPAVGAPFPPGTSAATLGRPAVGGAGPVGITAKGPAIVVSGCVRATHRGDEDEVFALDGAGPARSLSDALSIQGIDTYHLIGSLPDLRRHIDQQVEVIGLVQETESTDASRPLTLDVKSVRTTADTCVGGQSKTE